ncbi:MAG: hypothetical protein KDK44_05050 [Chlamydiia bacterium]|nr:hypothetical protein [Chlamydiia bacterium]
MKKPMSFILVGLIACGCASYTASSLTALTPTPVKSMTSGSEFTVACKAYNSMDCKRYLDRNVLEMGYQPIQIYIKNDTNKTYTFSPDKLSIPLANVGTIAQKAHTNTEGRVTGYALGGFLLWPLWIAAVVEGLKSQEANALLDSDFDAKVAKNVDLSPGQSYNAIVFVKDSDYKSEFTATLQEQNSNHFEVVPMVVR